MTFIKNVRGLMAMVAIAAVAFVGGISTQPTLQAPSQDVAYETTPGPYGSGVLADWSGYSHGLYCFQPGGGVTSYIKAAKSTAAQSSAAMACPGEDIRIYGDSITFSGKSALAAELTPLGYTLYVDGWSSRPTTPAVDALVAETVLPKIVIMATGTNDIFNPTVMGAQIQRAENHVAALNAQIAGTANDTQLFWVNVQATRWGQADYVERNDQRNSMSVNMDIYQRIPNTHVIDWAGRFMDNPNLLGTYLSDGVHPKTGAGYAYWAAILRGWLQTFGGI